MSHGTLREYRHSSEYDPSRDLYRLVRGWHIAQPLLADDKMSQLREAAEGLHYLHTRMVVHGDIKEVSHDLPHNL
jgi:serine/threonine protein kinase